MARHDVTSQTNGVANGAHEVRDKLDDRQNGTQGQRGRSHPEQAQEACAVFDKAQNCHNDEHRECQHNSHSKVRCWRERRWEQAKEVGANDEHEQRHDVGEVLNAVFAADVFDHFVDKTVGQLGNRLHPRWHNCALGRADNQQQEDRDNGKPSKALRL